MAGRLRFFTCLGFLMLAPAVSTAQTREAESTMTVQGTVAAVDHSARTVTIRSQQGTVTTLDVPENATRFDQVKVGDPVTATYYDRISVRVKPAGEAAVDQTIEPTVTATPGSLPGATRPKQRTVHRSTRSSRKWRKTASTSALSAICATFAVTQSSSIVEHGASLRPAGCCSR